MPRSVQGFSLIEFLVYLIVSSSATMLLFSYLTQSLHVSNELKKQARLELMIESCCSALAHDIQEANPDYSLWRLQENGIIFQRGDTSIAWLKEKNHIYRVSGTYDLATQQWRKKHKGLMLQSADTLACSIDHKSNRVISVLVSLSTGRKTKKQTISLANRVLL